MNVLYLEKVSCAVRSVSTLLGLSAVTVAKVTPWLKMIGPALGKVSHFFSYKMAWLGMGEVTFQNKSKNLDPS